MRIRNMSNDESQCAEQAKADHDCMEVIAMENGRFLNYLAKCRKDCSQFHASALAILIAYSALQSILDADGPEWARRALKAVEESMEDAIKLHGVENETRH
jgi:hypothetical protein